VGEFFRVLELEFLVKSSEIFLQLTTFCWQKEETLKMLYKRLLKLKDDTQSVATPLWPSVGVKPNTPECLEFNSKGQNTSHSGVFGVVGKVLKRRYRKCSRIGHLDICSSSYGQKKGRESN